MTFIWHEWRAFKFQFLSGCSNLIGCHTRRRLRKEVAALFFVNHTLSESDQKQRKEKSQCGTSGLSPESLNSILRDATKTENERKWEYFHRERLHRGEADVLLCG